jgi:hypothetical protein
MGDFRTRLPPDSPNRRLIWLRFALSRRRTGRVTLL